MKKGFHFSPEALKSFRKRLGLAKKNRLERMKEMENIDFADLPTMLTPEEAARVLSIARVTLARWSRQGKIRGIQLPNHHWRYPRVEIERILDGKPI